MRIVLNAVLLVVLASASSPEIGLLRAEQEELVNAARNVCNESMELLKRLSLAKDEPNKRDALGLRAEMKSWITGLDILVSQAPPADSKRQVEILAFASGVLKKSIAGMAGVLSRVSVWGKGFNTALSEKRKTLKDMESHANSFIERLQATLTAMARNALPSVERFLQGNIELVGTTLQLLSQIRLITITNANDNDLRAVGALVDALVEPLHGFRQDMTGWLSRLKTLFESDVKRLVIGVVENSSRGANAMIESLAIIRNHLSYFRLEGLLSDLQGTESEWGKVKSTSSLLEERYKRISTGVHLTDEDETVSTTTTNIDIEAFEAPVRPKAPKKVTSTTTTVSPSTLTTSSTSTTSTVATTDNMDLMDLGDESQWTEVKTSRRRMQASRRAKVKEPHDTAAENKSGLVAKQRTATASTSRPTSPPCPSTTSTPQVTSAPSSSGSPGTTTTRPLTSSTTPPSFTPTSTFASTTRSSTSTTGTTPPTHSNTTIGSSSTSPEISTTTSMGETLQADSVENSVSIRDPTTAKPGPIALTSTGESRKNPVWATTRPGQGRGARKGRYHDQHSTTSSVLLAPAVASISIQISSHADSLLLLMNQIWMLNQHASAVSPSVEAYEVLSDYQIDIEMLIEHMNEFRLKTQHIVAYTHSIPAMAFPL